MNIMTIRSIFRYSAIALCAFSLSACVTKRTVTEGGQTVEEGYVVKRPIKNAIENTTFE